MDSLSVEFTLLLKIENLVTKGIKSVSEVIEVKSMVSKNGEHSL